MASTIKAFKIFAKKWAKTLPPSRPCFGDLAFYRQLIKKYKNKKKPTKVLILGATPELRDLLSDFQAEVTVADVNIEMIRAMASLRRKKSQENFMVTKWQRLPLKEKFDLVLGDVSLPMLKPADISKTIRRIAQVLKPGGYFFHRTAVYNPKKIKIVKLIKDWRQKKIFIGDFRWLTELYSEYRSYNPKTKIDSKKVLYDNVQKLYQQGLITKKELKKFGVYRDNVKITILTKTEWLRLFLKYFKAAKIIMPKGYLFCRDLPIFVCKK